MPAVGDRSPLRDSDGPAALNLLIFEALHFLEPLVLVATCMQTFAGLEALHFARQSEARAWCFPEFAITPAEPFIGLRGWLACSLGREVSRIINRFI